jgi:hypothetical protein
MIALTCKMQIQVRRATNGGSYPQTYGSVFSGRCNDLPIWTPVHGMNSLRVPLQHTRDNSTCNLPHDNWVLATDVL